MGLVDILREKLVDLSDNMPFNQAKYAQSLYRETESNLGSKK
jgi:hypothetical protein